jgi:hypothetical protein
MREGGKQLHALSLLSALSLWQQLAAGVLLDHHALSLPDCIPVVQAERKPASLPPTYLASGVLIVCVARSLLRALKRIRDRRHENFRVVSSPCKFRRLSSPLNPQPGNGGEARNFFLQLLSKMPNTLKLVRNDVRRRRTMTDNTQHRVANLMTLWEAAFLKLPLAGAKWGWGVGKEQEVVEAAWKGYDAWVRLANTQVDDLYQAPLVGELTVRFLDMSLRWQRFGTALADAFFAGLWPAVGLPTSAAMQALTEESRSLTARLKAQDAHIQILHKELRSLAADSPIQRKRRASRVGLDASLKAVPEKMNGHRPSTFPTASI